MGREQVPFPEKLVGYLDIAKGLGELALEFVTKRFITEPKDHMSEHFHAREPEHPHTET